ncbi:MAG: alkyl hydroperoxide reductase [Candidatus Rehaiarchaeum fermentans]|nr:redoxin domain-containing protein [Candidatus Rehaiarchaeum fermentans]
MKSAVNQIMKTKIKFILYAIIAIFAIFIIVKLFLIENAKNAKYLSVGEIAPNYAFQLSNGTITSIYNYRGKTTLLWFVVTWCSSCAEGNSVLANNIAFFEKHNITIIELEQYDDLGQNGMPISKFVSIYGNNNTYVQTGIASYNMTIAYNTPPNFQLDIYYLINPSGKILYIGEGLAEGISTLENIITENKL